MINVHFLSRNFLMLGTKSAPDLAGKYSIVDAYPAAFAAFAPSYEVWLNDLSLIPAVSNATQTFCFVPAAFAGATATDVINDAAAIATTTLYDFFKIPPKD